MAKLENRFPMSRPSHNGMCSGDSASDRNTTGGYKPIQTASEVLTSDGGAPSPSPSKANQLPNELSTVRSWNSENFLPSARRRLRSSEVSHLSRSSAVA